jgi:hypothetical protein
LQTSIIESLMWAKFQIKIPKYDFDGNWSPTGKIYFLLFIRWKRLNKNRRMIDTILIIVFLRLFVVITQHLQYAFKSSVYVYRCFGCLCTSHVWLKILCDYNEKSQEKSTNHSISRQEQARGTIFLKGTHSSPGSTRYA